MMHLFENFELEKQNQKINDPKNHLNKRFKNTFNSQTTTEPKQSKKLIILNCPPPPPPPKKKIQRKT